MLRRKHAEGLANTLLASPRLLAAAKKEIRMKYSTIRWAMFIAAVAVVTLLTAGSPAEVQAQTIGLHVNIPFEFHVGEQLLPAGSYTVWLRGGSAISVSDGKGQSAMRMANPINRASTKSAAESILVFMGYGNQFFLDEVRWAGYLEARSLVKTRSEIEYAKSFAPSQIKTATVAVK